MTINPESTDPELCSILVVDVENSSSRRNLGQATLRASLYNVLDTALARCGMVLPPGHCEDRGDGALLIFPQDVAKVVDIFDPLIEAIIDVLRLKNSETDPVGWLRLRIGAHFGQVHRDGRGWSSTDLNATFRIVDDDVTKDVLREAARAQCVITVSEFLHQMVVQHGYRSINPADYRRFAVVAGSREFAAWMRVPGYPRPPLPDAAEQPAKVPVTVVPDAAASRISIGDVRGNVSNNNVFNNPVRARTIVAGNNFESGRAPADE